MNQNEKASAMLYDGEEQKTEKNSAEGKNGERIRETYVETLFIDDSAANIETGARMGLKTLLYDVNTNLACEVEKALKELGE